VGLLVGRGTREGLLIMSSLRFLTAQQSNQGPATPFNYVLWFWCICSLIIESTVSSP
jgi:hypothetical protein